MAVEAETHEVARAQREVAVEGALLGHIADVLSSSAGRLPVDEHAAGRRLEQAEQDPDERRLAGAVRAEHGEELARLQVEAEPFPERPLVEAQRELVDRDDRAHCASAAASCRACRSCHCWNVSFGGNVSVTPTTGIPACFAAARTRDVMGETAWLL